MYTANNIPSNIQSNEFTIPIGLGIFAIIFIIFLIITIIIISTFYALECKKHKEFTKSSLTEKEQELISKYRKLSTKNKNIIDDTINTLTNKSIDNEYQNDGN